ncbi:PI31 proteasome regulator N-terminal-domain-containing protein [Pseudomassariella vexata]|uniref:PI31 proteasome regulator N-terminal-domain-containing protein n=1 Tax=Pseudomassariella vexata TaxID=1141098 RepID=A0A1Y2DFZ0_9PEZI|nr:PI31 proteasome regulator N-terminal-domain-containing protein [Pseudomassariella vexata]ORY58178.1 PI31 proteasome regulator N-terminal-domain-containing protein [Pseudomassariella vexata]
MSSNPLSPSVILQGMADALSPKLDGDNTSSLSSSHEALALFTHACMVSLGFRLLGFDEERTEESKCREMAPRLPENWNASFNTCAFVYAHSQSALRFVIKTDRIGGKAEIRGLAIEDDRITRVEVTTKDFISNGALPVRIPRRDDSTEDRSNLPQKLKNVFISEGRITDLANLIKIKIIQKLLPALQKEGYEETEDDRVARDDADEAGRRPPRQPYMPDPLPQPANPYPFNDPLNPPPRNPVPAGDFPPPSFEDPYDINRPPRGQFPPNRSPFGNLGADDLNPPGLGPHDPFRPSLGGGGLPRPGGPRGMHPTFDDPMFGGIGGEPGYDPQVPPGARYDPLGPGGVPRLGGRRPGGGNDPFGGGGGFGGFGGFGGGDII